MANERKIRIGAEFDVTAVLAGINQIKQQLSSMNVDSGLFKDAQKDLDKITKLLPTITSGLKDGIPQKNLNSYLKTLNTITDLYKQLPQKIKQIQISTGDLNLSAEVERQLEQIDNEAKVLSDKLNNLFGTELKEKLKKAIPDEIFSTKLLNSLSNVEKGMDSFDTQVEKTKKDASSLKTSLDAAFSKPSFANFDLGEKLNLAKTKADILKVRNELEAIKNSEKDKKIIPDNSYEKIYRDLTSYADKLNEVTLLQQSRASIEQILADTSSTGEQLREQLTQKLSETTKVLNDELAKRQVLQKEAADTAQQEGQVIVKTNQDIESSATKANNAFMKQDSLLKQLAMRATSLIGIGAIFNYITRAVREAWNGIRDLDKEFTQIAVVTDKTTSELWRSFSTYSQMAQGLGVTTKDAVATSALYYQQGLKTADVMTLTAETIKMAQIAGMDFATATNQMTAAIRGFNLEMSDASKVNDIFSTLAANAAVSTQELAYALTKTASIAESAGMSIDTTSAFLTKMIETTREAPENIGTAMKSIVARFEELKKNPLSLTVEVEGEEVVANKVESAIALAGVALRDAATGQFRDLDKVFLELAKAWDGLDRNTQRYIATIAAGSRQQSRFIAMMDGYERTLELVELAQDSEGQSAVQFLKTLDSLDSKLNKISNSLESLYQKFVNSEFFGGLLDGLNDLLQGLGKLDAGTLAVFGVLGITIGSKIIQGVIQSIGNLGPQMTAAFTKRADKIKEGLLQVNKNGLIYKRTESVLTKNSERGKIESQLANQVFTRSNKAGTTTIVYDLNTLKANEKLANLRDSIRTLKQDIQEKKKMGIDTTEAQAKLNELTLEANELKNTEAALRDQNGQIITGKKAEPARNLLINSEEYKQLTNSMQVSEEQVLNKAKEMKANLVTAMGQVGPAMVSALSIGITTALATDDPWAVVIASGTTFATTILPNIFNNIATAIETGKSVIEVAGGWMTIAIKALMAILSVVVPLAISDIKHLVKSLEPESKKLQDQINALEDRHKELEEKSEKTTAEAAVQKTTYKKLQSLEEEYFKLYETTGRTTDENERLQTIITQIEEEFPDLIEKYTEAGVIVKSQKQDWQEILELQKENAKQANLQAFSDTISTQEDNINNLILHKKHNKASLDEGLYEEIRGAIDHRTGASLGLLSSFYTAPMLGIPGLVLNQLVGREVSDKIGMNAFAKEAKDFKSVEDYRNYLANFQDVLTDEQNKRIEELLDIYSKNDQNYQKELQRAKEQEEKTITNYFVNYIKSFGDSDSLTEYSDTVIENLGKNYAKKAVSKREYNINNILTDEDFVNTLIGSGSLGITDTLLLQGQDIQNKLKRYREELKSNGHADATAIFSKEELESFQGYIDQYVQTVYEQEVEQAVDELDKVAKELKQNGNEKTFDILNNMGSYGASEVKTAYNSLTKEQQGIFAPSYNDIIKKGLELEDYDEITGTYNETIYKVIEKYGTDLAEYIKKQKLGEQATDAVVESLNDLNLTGEEGKGLIELINTITDWSDPGTIKSLAKQIYELTGDTEKAVDAALDLREAFTNPFNMDLNANAAFTDLGKTLSDIKKNYKDLNSAIEEYNEYNKLSGETILGLIESGNMMYLTYNKETEAVEINAQAIEAAFQMEVMEARQSLEMKKQNALTALAELEVQKRLTKEKIKALDDALKAKDKQQKIEALQSSQNLNNEGKTTLQITQTNNEAMFNEEETFFEQLTAAEKQHYEDLITLATQSGIAQRKGYYDGLNGVLDSSDKLDFNLTSFTQSQVYNSFNQLDEYQEKVNSIIEGLNNNESETELDKQIRVLRDELVEQLGAQEKATEAYEKYVEAIDNGLSVYDAITSSGMLEFYKDTSSALADATKELEDYISTLERYYTLQKQIEKLEDERQKALNKWKKTGLQEYLDEVISASQTELEKAAQLAYVGKEDKTRVMSEGKNKLSKYFTTQELINLQLDDLTGLLDLDKFYATKEYKAKTQNDEQGKAIDDILQDMVSDIEKAQGWIDKEEEIRESIIEGYESQKEELEKIVKSLDRLENINRAVESINNILEEAKQANEDYYETGGKEGISGVQLLKAEAETITSLVKQINETDKYKADVTQELNDKDLMKYVYFNEGDQKYYRKPEMAEEYLGLQATEEGQKLAETLDDLINKYNDLTDATNDAKKAQDAEARSMRNTAKSLRQSYSDLINRVADDMAKLDQKEIDEVKKKYQMIQEEDDKYLDALQKSIDKQRRLRDQANSYDDLEKDEKRLALLERDTSGANAAEIAALKEQIKDARQNLVDTEQDNIVNSIAEDNQLRKDRMDEETEFLQNVMDERTYDMQYYIDQARDIVDAAINGDAGAYRQLLDICHQAEEDFFRNTAEAQAIFNEELKGEILKAQDWSNLVISGFASIATSTKDEIKDTAEKLAESATGLSTYSGQIDKVRESIELLDGGKPFEEVKTALDEAIEKAKAFEIQCKEGDYTIEVPIVYKDMGDGTGGKGNGNNPSTTGKYYASHYDSASGHYMITGYYDNEKDAEKASHQGGQGYWGETSQLKDVKKAGQTYGAYDEKYGYDWYDLREKTETPSKTQSKEYVGAETGSKYTSQRIEVPLTDYQKEAILGLKITKEGIEKITNQDNFNSLQAESIKNRSTVIPGECYTNDPSDGGWVLITTQGLEDFKVVKSTDTGEILELIDRSSRKIKKFANGGLVDYTGPAWVDGTPTNPEAFLSVEDTRNIQTLTNILGSILSPASSPSPAEKSEVKSGDTNIEIHIDVEQISDDYDVDQMLDVIQQRISEASEGNVTIVK